MSIFHNTSLPVGLAIQRGDVNNFSGVQKFGYNSSVGTSFETIWDAGGDYTFITSAGTATATSSNTGADDNGTVEIQGLDSNYDLATETITIGGSAGSTSFIRVFRALMLTATTGNANVGTITITVSSTTVAQIQPTYGQTLMAVYTVPRKYQAYLIQLDIGSSKDLENEIKFRIKQIDNGNVWNTRSFITARGGFTEKNYPLPEIILEKTDIEMRAKSSATSSISGGFELFLEKVDQS